MELSMDDLIYLIGRKEVELYLLKREREQLVKMLRAENEGPEIPVETAND